MSNQSDLTFRNLDPINDFDQLIQLRIDIEEMDQYGLNTTPEHLRAQFNWPNHDPARDRWVIELSDSKQLVGYGWTFAQSNVKSVFEVVVHPNWRRQGLGSHLAQLIIDYIKSLGATQIVSGTRGNNLLAPPFLAATNFKPMGHNRFMKAPAGTPRPAPQWPDGFTLRSYRELGDLTPFVNGSNLCYADMWGHRENSVPNTVAHLSELMEKYPEQYAPDGMLALFDADNNIAGVCFNRVTAAGEKILDSPGVGPAYRHLNLHSPLVVASMAWLDSQAEGGYHLDTWGDSDRAFELYQSLGFMLEPKNHIIEYLLIES